ncbi:MAG: LPS export ABC transporter permease LptF [Micavibrio sp.]|nr:LPS export ABC transporter permease LptF [Micavibrio sp.]
MTRYLMKNLLQATVFIALTLTAVIWLTQSLKILDLVANSDAPFSLFVKLVALMLPKFLETILPVALVIAVLFTYNRMIMDNELVILRSCGFDQRSLARPALVLGMVLTAVLFALTTYITPVSYTKMQEMRNSLKSEYSTFLLREGIFNTFGTDLTVYLRARSENGDLVGLLIQDARDKNKPPVSITAKRGQLVMNGDVPNIIVYDGMRQQLENANGSISKLYFSQYTIEVKGLESSTQTRNRDASERTLTELMHPDLSNKYDRDHIDAFNIEAQGRLVAPFAALGYPLFALSALLLGPFNRRGQGRKVFMGAVGVAFLIIANMAVDNALKKHPGLIPMLYVIAFLPIVAGYYVLGGTGEQQVMALLRRINARRHARLERGAAA